MMRLFLEPVEPLLFRTGRPFDAGQDSFAESLFPPTPETLQGAVRAAIASYWDPRKNIADAFEDVELTKRIGDQKGYGRFRIIGLALGRYHKVHPEVVERLFPPPAHILKAGQQLYRLLPRPLGKTVLANFPEEVDYYLAPERELEGDFGRLGGWVKETDLDRLLGVGDITGIETVGRERIYQVEPRLGIGIQRETKAAEEGYLYQTLMIRMNPYLEEDYVYGFVVDIDLLPLSSEDARLTDEQIQQELHLPDSGWVVLGGEQRTAHFRVLSTPSKQAKTEVGKRSLLYLATPAAFNAGWKPSPRLAPLDAPLAAAVNRYESIGGWRLNAGNAGGESKVMRRCVPAGSVYFFDKQVPLPQAVTDYGMEIGYGISFQGEW